MSQITSHFVGRISEISDFEEVTGVTVVFAGGREYLSPELISAVCGSPWGKNGDLKLSVDVCARALSRSSGTVMKSVMKESQALCGGLDRRLLIS